MSNNIQFGSCGSSLATLVYAIFILSLTALAHQMDDVTSPTWNWPCNMKLLSDFTRKSPTVKRFLQLQVEPGFACEPKPNCEPCFFMQTEPRTLKIWNEPRQQWLPTHFSKNFGSLRSPMNVSHTENVSVSSFNIFETVFPQNCIRIVTFYADRTANPAFEANPNRDFWNRCQPEPNR